MGNGDLLDDSNRNQTCLGNEIMRRDVWHSVKTNVGDFMVRQCSIALWLLEVSKTAGGIFFKDFGRAIIYTFEYEQSGLMTIQKFSCRFCNTGEVLKLEVCVSRYGIDICYGRVDM